MSNKTSLLDAALIFTYRGATPDREANLDAMLQHIDLTFCDYRIILVESDIAPKFDWKKHGNKRIDYVFLYSNGAFHKSLLCNTGAKMAKSDVILFNDVDCILNPAALQDCIQRIRDGSVDVYYPYNEVIDVLGDAKARFMAQPTYDMFEGVRGSTLLPDMLYACGPIPGGIKACRREAFVQMGGYHLDMQGWGWENIEFYERAVRLGLRAANYDASLFHLHHDTLVRDANHPDAARNANIKNMTNNMPIDELNVLAARLRRFFS